MLAKRNDRERTEVGGELAHRSVMVREVVEAIAPRSGGFYLDCTLGWGGHSEAILQASGPDGCVIGLDRDPDAREAASERLAGFGDRFTAVLATFDQARDVLDGHGLDGVDGVVADLGVSSPQIDRSERGFSFMNDGPLDMRMGPDTDVTAADLIECMPTDDLARLIREYGEERHARRIARDISGQRFTTTGELAAAVSACVPASRQRIHPATRTFQALRIAVNDELGQLDRLLEGLLGLLKPGGRAAIISFHSLEDRRVKRAFRALAGEGAPRDAFGHPVVAPRATLVGRRAVQAGDDPNPRARSARLRVIECVRAVAEDELAEC